MGKGWRFPDVPLSLLRCLIQLFSLLVFIPEEGCLDVFSLILYMLPNAPKCTQNFIIIVVVMNF